MDSQFVVNKYGKFIVPQSIKVNLFALYLLVLVKGQHASRGVWDSKSREPYQIATS